MIVVSVGTNEARFDRLLEWVSGLRLEDELVVQHGPSTVRPPGARCVPYLPYEDLVELVRQMPRLRHARWGRLDHDGALRRPSAGGRAEVEALRRGRRRPSGPACGRLQAEGLVTHVESVDDSERPHRRSTQIAHTGGATALQHELHEYLAGLTAS